MSRRKVLVVDSNPDSADILAELLRALGQEAGVVYDSWTALEEVVSQKPELVLLDIGFPDIDGYDIAKKIRDRCGDRSPVLVAITGWGRAGDIEPMGFDHRLLKPVTVPELMSILDVI